MAERLSSLDTRGMGLDRLGRTATMPAFDAIAKRESTRGITVIEIGAGLGLHGVAMEQYWLQMCRSTALETVSDFAKILRNNSPLADSDGRLSDYFPDQRYRNKVVEQFADTHKGTYHMLVAALTELLANPPDLPRSKSSHKRKRQLQEDFYERFSMAMAYKHNIEIDIPTGEHGFGERRIVVPQMYGGESFRDVVYKVMGSDDTATVKTLLVLAGHFGAMLHSPRIIRPFQVITMDTRDPEQLAEVANRVYPEWFKDTKTFKRAMEFNGFRRQKQPWELDSLEEGEANHVIIKNPSPTAEDQDFREFTQEAPAIIAKGGFLALVPAFIQYENESVNLQLGAAIDDTGYKRIINDWERDHDFQVSVQGNEVVDIAIAGVNDYERDVFHANRALYSENGKTPQRLYVVSFKKPKKGLSERAKNLESSQ